MNIEKIQELAIKFRDVADRAKPLACIISYIASQQLLLGAFILRMVCCCSNSFQETIASAHAQIEEKQYEVNLIAKGISKDKIRKYGFAFEGKYVLIG